MSSSPSLLAINPFFAIALFMLIAAGCNAFEFMYGDQNSNDPDVILEDARIALQNGDAEKAVELLEKALDKAPESQEIRIELSSALFQANGIDLLTMKDLAEFISEQEATVSKASIMQSASCNFNEDPIFTRQLQFENEEAYVQLLNNSETLARSIELLATALELDAPTDLADHIIGNAYLMRAIASMGEAVLEIKATADALGATLHQRTNNSIGYCAPTPSALAEIESVILCEQLPVFNAAIEDLLFRQNLLGLTESELVDAVSQARDELNNVTSQSCSPFYPVTQ